MKPKHQRLLFIAATMIFLIAAALLTLQAFRENLVFFYSPSDIAAQKPDASRLIRIGGLVEANTVKKEDGGGVQFAVTDGQQSIEVRYDGLLPPLFREGQGVVAEGYMTAGADFSATRVLTKHDENYMPKEVVDALKKTGRWQEGNAQ
ncbi:MAG: cytochrome c maturation protein CcmE [Alphaproteobacteria bacterium]|nr:cytochrome c maturation protein CcmE [Alphaproteobacteria bacterium]